jgi:amidase
MGHGTDIAGSIRYPAYACGLHGLRPSLGRVPAYNASGPDRLIGAQLMAVSGPIARTVADIELSMQALMAPDVRDPWYVSARYSGTPLPKRVALTFAPDGMAVVDEVRAALGDAAEKLRDAGWEVAEVDCPPVRPLARLNEQLWMADTQLGMGDMVAREGDAAAQFVYRLMSESAGTVDFEVMMKALQSRAQLVREWELFMQQYPIVLCPVSGDLPFAQQLDVSSEAAFADIMEAQLTQRAIPVLGCPAMAVATGQSSGAPIGVQLIGPKFREDVVIAAGRDIERAGWTPSVVTPTWD